MAVLKVFSYNIHKGFSPALKKFTLHRIRDAIRHAHPDLVFLQEVQGLTKKGRSQFEYLSEELWPHFSYGKNAIYFGGHHGNAILSKFPISSWDNIDISQNRFERRGLLHVTVELPSNLKIHGFCTHLNLLEGDRAKQIKQIVDHIQGRVTDNAPILFAGDFNDWRELVSSNLQSGLGLKEVFNETQGRSARTFPSVLPFFRLDRIYYRGFGLQSVKEYFGQPWTQLSDHLPLQAVLEVKS